MLCPVSSRFFVEFFRTRAFLFLGGLRRDIVELAYPNVVLGVFCARCPPRRSSRLGGHPGSGLVEASNFNNSKTKTY